ncbi:MAG TPA: glycosyltransferase family 39 protein [Draconibacterium sp.]|nr:glycosyltransferase family 39 protein [Draconibacterium sp.]
MTFSLLNSKVARTSILVGLLSVILLFSFLGNTSVFQVAEARNAECAREMLEGRDLIVPTFNGELRTDKPVLEYYGMMAAYKIGGINEASARFFSALCGLLVVLATFWIVKRHISLKAAWWSAVALLSSLHVIVQFRLATPDPYLILFHTLSIYFFYEGWKSGRWKWYAAMYISLGLGILAKGPVGLVLPAFSVFVFLLLTRNFNWRTLAVLKPWWGILIILLVSLPWYGAVHVKTDGAWTNGFFIEHNINRFSDGMGSHNGPFFITFIFILFGMIPLSVWFIRAFANAWISRKENKLILLALVSFVVVVVFYALSKTKLINYTSPAYPFFAILLGTYFSKLTRKGVKRTNIKPELYVLAVLGIAIPTGVYFYTKNTDPLYSITWVAWLFVVVPVGIIAALLMYKKSIEKGLLTVAATFMLTIFMFFAIPLHVLNHQSPVETFKAEVQSHINIIEYKNYNNAFAFYAHNRIPTFENQEELQDYLNNHDNVLVLSRSRDLSYMDSIPNLTCIAKGHDLFSGQYSGIYEKK